METGREKILMDMEKFPMSALSGRSETAGRIWDRKSLCSRMTERMMDTEV